MFIKGRKKLSQQEIDVLAFGAHPDDVEIGMAGSIAKWVASGKSIVICDLTEAELSSNGNVESRRVEAANSAEILGIKERINLQLPDRGLYISDENINLIAGVIRKYKPKLIFAPYEKDRHPDHGNCSHLVREAFFSAGICKYKVKEGYPAHKANNLFFYLINGFTKPHFMIDISDFMDKKVEALKAYQSQFFLNQDGVRTPLTDGYIESLVSRERLFGKEVGVTYAEGFMTSTSLLIHWDIFGEGEN